MVFLSPSLAAMGKQVEKDMMMQRFFLGLSLVIFLGAPPVFANTNVADRAQHLREAGARELAARRVDAALQLFQQALVANPKAVENYVALAGVETVRGRVDIAARYYATALELEPINPAALLGDGLLALSQDVPDRARARLERLVLSCGQCPEEQKLRAAIPAQ